MPFAVLFCFWLFLFVFLFYTPFLCTPADLLERMLKIAPEERITIHDALKHPYFERYEFPSCDTTV